MCLGYGAAARRSGRFVCLTTDLRDRPLCPTERVAVRRRDVRRMGSQGLRPEISPLVADDGIEDRAILREHSEKVVGRERQVPKRMAPEIDAY